MHATRAARRSRQAPPRRYYNETSGTLSWETDLYAKKPVVFSYWDIFDAQDHAFVIEYTKMICAYRGGLSPPCSVDSIGKSIKGVDLDRVIIGTGPLIAWAAEIAERELRWAATPLLHCERHRVKLLDLPGR